MKKVIHKHRLGFDTCDVTTVAGFEILDVAFQDGEPHVWVLVREHVRQVFVKFLIVETGVTFDTEGWKFVKTLHTKNPDGRNYVCHVFTEQP